MTLDCVAFFGHLDELFESKTVPLGLGFEAVLLQLVILFLEFLSMALPILLASLVPLRYRSSRISCTMQVSGCSRPGVFSLSPIGHRGVGVRGRAARACARNSVTLHRASLYNGLTERIL